MIIGELNQLTVKRISDIAYILTDGISDDEIFLHKKEAEKDYKVGDSVTVFLYEDSKRRIAASTHVPLITASKPAFLEVVEVIPELGFFLYDGMPKDLLLSVKDFPYEKDQFPEVGDMLYVYLKTTKDNFRAKLLPKEAFYDYMHPTGHLNKGDETKAYVVQTVPLGLVAFTLDGREIFIPNSLYRGKKRIGEEVTTIIETVVDDRHYHGSLLKPKAIQMDEDMKKVLNYLKIHRQTNLTDKSEPIAIYQAFQLSKAAYKRALGALYKERLIDLTDEQVTLKS